MSTAARERRKVSPSSSEKEAGSVPSGFVLKLFQMVNGASDEVVSVSAPALRWPLMCAVIFYDLFSAGGFTRRNQ